MLKQMCLAVVLFGLALVPSMALANGAMGLGLEQWDLRFWIAYVIVTIAFEAWYIGDWLKLGWTRRLALSFGANFLTGMFCGGLGLCAPLLHYPLIGTTANPNPLFSGVALLMAFAIPSAFVEFYVWDNGGYRQSPRILTHVQLFGRTMTAHLVGVPLALVILLIPSRPYIGMEVWANYWRRDLLRDFKKDLEVYVYEHHALPRARTVEELLHEVPQRPSDSDRPRQPRWPGLYLAEFTRFDTGETKRNPMSLDINLAGKRVDEEQLGDETHFQWYLRPGTNYSRYLFGIQVNTLSGEVQMARYPDGKPVIH